LSDGKLAERCRQLGVRCYRLAEAAFDADAAAVFKRWGDQLMAQADALETSRDTVKTETDEG